MEIFKGRDSSPPCVPQLRIEIPAITLNIEYDKKISLTSIVFIVLEIARILLKQILEQINEMLVESYCGKRYERGKECRNGYTKRTIVTLLGEITLHLARIRGKGIPLYSLVEFESRRKYQSDIKAISVNSALRMTYRDARDEINRFTSSPSHQTIWRYVQELGEKAKRKLSANVFFAEDSTKLHSWNGKIELTIFEGENVVVRVSREERMKTEEELNGLIALGDADRRLNFKERQIDLIHVWREVNTAWQHGVDIETRRKYVNEVKGILLRLKNSLGKSDLESRIKRAEKALNEFVEEMESKGYWRVSRFFKRHMKSILLFAYKRLEGINIPWHNNKIRRWVR